MNYGAILFSIIFGGLVCGGLFFLIRAIVTSFRTTKTMIDEVKSGKNEEFNLWRKDPKQFFYYIGGICIVWFFIQLFVGTGRHGKGVVWVWLNDNGYQWVEYVVSILIWTTVSYVGYRLKKLKSAKMNNDSIETIKIKSE